MATSARWLSIVLPLMLGVGCTQSRDNAATSNDHALRTATAMAPASPSSCAPIPSQPSAAASAPSAPPSAAAARVADSGKGNRLDARDAPSTAAKSAAAKPEPASVVTDAPLKVKRLVLARAIHQREPVDPAASFSAADAPHVYAFVEVDNPERAESEIFVTFEQDHGSSKGLVRLRVGPSPRWRTWASSRAVHAPGDWIAVVRNAAGTVLAKAPFVVTAEAKSPADPAAKPADPVSGAATAAPAAPTK